MAYDSGFESLSGFSDSFKTIFGVSPTQSKQHNVVNLKRIETPLGTMIACASERGICLLEFSDRKMLESRLKDIAKRRNAHILQGENAHFSILEQQLTEYFSGKQNRVHSAFGLGGSEFQLQVWRIY